MKAKKMIPFNGEYDATGKFLCGNFTDDEFIIISEEFSRTEYEEDGKEYSFPVFRIFIVDKSTMTKIVIESDDDEYFNPSCISYEKWSVHETFHEPTMSRVLQNAARRFLIEFTGKGGLDRKKLFQLISAVLAELTRPKYYINFRKSEFAKLYRSLCHNGWQMRKMEGLWTAFQYRGEDRWVLLERSLDGDCWYSVIETGTPVSYHTDIRTLTGGKGRKWSGRNYRINYDTPTDDVDEFLISILENVPHTGHLVPQLYEELMELWKKRGA